MSYIIQAHNRTIIILQKTGIAITQCDGSTSNAFYKCHLKGALFHNISMGL